MPGKLPIDRVREAEDAQRIYTRLGYRPEPARDWDPQPELLPDVHLRAWTKEL